MVEMRNNVCDKSPCLANEKCWDSDMTVDENGARST
jgi:hypothetical protein